MKRFLTLICVFALLSGTAVAGSLPGQGKTVRPARATWTTGFFLEALYSRGLEELGYTVEAPKDLSGPIFYQSLVLGDIDYWANGWFPLHNEMLPGNFDEKAEIVGKVVEAGAIQGYLVSKDAVEKYDIKSLADFKRPEVKKAFDANGDGKSDLVACPPGWGCEKIISHHMEAYDLEDHVNAIKASYTPSMADAVARYESGEPVFFYTWTPNWTVYKLKPGKDVVWVNVPEINPAPEQKGLKDALTATGLEGAVTDPIKMGFVANDIAVVANKEFLAENPAAKKLMRIMSVPLSDIAAQNNKMFAGEDRPGDIERHVDEWIAANRKQWDAWIEEAMQAAK